MKVIGIGASAGGLEAMTELLSKLPDNTGAAYVFLQHLSPDSKSMIGEILSRHTKMPVTVVYESKPTLPNHIFVMPENKNLTYSHGMLVANDRDPGEKLNLPIDKFFHTLGEQLKEEAVGILLSGTGTDGTRGLRTIKEKGGIVLVQEPGSAKFDGMPKAALHLKIADQVMTAQEIGRSIGSIINKRRALKDKNPLIDRESPSPFFDKIIDYLSQWTEIDFWGYRTPTLLRRLENRMVLQDISEIKDYYNYLVSDKAEAKALFNDFLIGVTRFFRDPEAFEILNNEILPKIFEQEKPEEEPYRFWIPACSTGEEAYTFAMLIDQYIRKNDLNADYKIFASDVDEEAIKYATRGTYSCSLAADTPYNLRAQYFVQEGEEFRIRSFLRKKVLFAVQNLIGDPPFIHMDLVSCRNLLIYLKPETQQNILATLHFALNEDGFLMLGPSETLGDLKYAFTKYTRRWNIFTKHSGAKVGVRSNFAMDNDSFKTQSFTSSITSKAMANFDNYGSEPFTQYLVERFAPVALFVNQDLDILYMNGDVDKVLNMPRALARLNLKKMLPNDVLLTFKAGAEEVLENQEEIIYTDVSLKKGKEKFKAEIRFDQPRLGGIHQDKETFKNIVLIEIRLLLSKEGEENNVQDHRKIKVENLRRELRSAKKRSHELVNELENTNEELQASNRELLASNEELQSTNEELQSVNEELYTVNSELQIKNEELATANNDINNLLKSTEIGTIFLDKKLKIRKFTPAVRKQFDLLGSDIGRPITNFSSAFKNLDIKANCKQVFDSLESFEQEAIDKSGVHYLVRILPYRTEEDIIDGLVINFVNIEKLTQTQRQVNRLANKYRAIFNYSSQVLAVMRPEGDVSSMNRPFGPYHQNKMVGQNLFEVLPDELTAKLKPAFEQVLKQEKAETLEVQFGNNHWYEISLIPSHPEDENAEETTVLLMAQDITEQKYNLHRLKSSLEEYKSFMDNAPQQISLIKADGTIHYINHARYTGKTKEELIGDSVYKYVPEDKLERYKEIIKNVMAGKPFARLKFDFDYKGGNKGKVELVATPVILNGDIKYVAIAQNSVELND